MLTRSTLIPAFSEGTLAIPPSIVKLSETFCSPEQEIDTDLYV